MPASRLGPLLAVVVTQLAATSAGVDTGDATHQILGPAREAQSSDLPSGHQCRSAAPAAGDAMAAGRCRVFYATATPQPSAVCATNTEVRLQRL